ncbi:MAG: hypothetical protein FD135_3604 [Comamonadaceae bacterium]|nr:MAG: hypothetical protein FD135_3604 [Comamonadaceae bacterium]
MNMFQVSEAEYNALQSVRGQLNLVSCLLCATGSNSSLFNAEDLNEFLGKQVDAMRGVMRAVDARYEEQRGEGLPDYRHWNYALKIASGDRIHTPQGAEKLVLEGLMKAARIDADMSGVIALWLEILDKQKPAQEVTAPAKKPAQRKRDKMAAKTLEVV